MGVSTPLVIWPLLRYLGPRWLLFRSWYAFKQRSGLLRRQSPPSDWDAQPLSTFLRDHSLDDPELYLDYRRQNSPVFFFLPQHRTQFVPYFASWDRNNITPVFYAEQVRQGAFRYFEHTPVQVGFPPAWHRNPFTQEQIPPEHHWSQISDFGSSDIKIIWEPSRFGFIYALVRAYWRTGDERYAESFWQLLESWQSCNPPQFGPHWKCGQEISLRVMAWCFGLYGFLGCQATTAKRVMALAQMIAVSGQRIEANLSYAISQRNNHGISEAMGLWTVGALFPELSSAVRWQNVGRQALEDQGRALIYDDGAFSQHSVNYQRLMLHDYLWSLRLGDLHKQPFSSELKERVARAGAFLHQIQDEKNGRVPYYGQNDGSLILPLSNCNYHDFRPVIQAIQYLTEGTRCYAGGAWDEDLLWLFGHESLAAPVRAAKKVDFRAESGGYYTMRSKEGFVFTRCNTFRHRPGQADLLHLDIWWRGQNIACDAGTYSYNSPKPWNNPLGHTTYHNTVTVDGLDQMRRVGKFLWLPWVRGWMNGTWQEEDGHVAYWEGEHDGYRHLRPAVCYRRGIMRLGDDCWLVLDRLQSVGTHRYRLHWLLPDIPYEVDAAAGHIVMHTSGGPYHLHMSSLSDGRAFSLVRADQDSARGWRAPYYNYREPALSVGLIEEATSTYFWSLFSPVDCRVMCAKDMLSIDATHWQATVRIPQTNSSESKTILVTEDVQLKIA